MAAKKGLSWCFAVAVGVMAVSVVVDWGRGEGLDWAVVAFLLMVGPHVVGEVLRAYGRDRAAARADAVSNWLVLPACAVLCMGLIIGWTRGKGTPWLPFTAAVLISLGAAMMGVAALRRRRAAA